MPRSALAGRPSWSWSSRSGPQHKRRVHFVARGTLVSVLICGLPAGRYWYRALDEPGVALSDETGAVSALKERMTYRSGQANLSRGMVDCRACDDRGWGVSTFGWFDTATGRAVLARTFSIAFVIVVAHRWELVSPSSSAIWLARERRTRSTQPAGSHLAAMLRNAFLIFPDRCRDLDHIVGDRSRHRAVAGRRRRCRPRDRVWRSVLVKDIITESSSCSRIRSPWATSSMSVAAIRAG